MKKSLILLIMCMAIAIIFPSCEKEVYDINPQMESFYIESTQLPTVAIDSVQCFSKKVDEFTTSFPEALEHEKYPLIKENIRSASLRITISCDTKWRGETVIKF